MRRRFHVCADDNGIANTWGSKTPSKNANCVRGSSRMISLDQSARVCNTQISHLQLRRATALKTMELSRMAVRGAREVAW